MIPPKSTFVRELVPQGTHLARIVRLIYLGTQDSGYTNEDGSPKMISKLDITWELPNELRTFKEGEPQKPMVISQEISHSMNKNKSGKPSTLRQLVENVIGTSLAEDEARKWDTDQLLGMPCMINVIHETSKKSGNKYSKVSSVSGVMKGIECPPAVNKLRVLDMDKNWDEDYFKSLTSFISDKMKKTKEYEKLMGTDIKEDIKPEDIPF